MTFAVGSTIEQRYPGATEGLARMGAADRMEAFRAAGWEVREEQWVPDWAAVTAPEESSLSLGTPPGSLVVLFVAAREASVPASLRPQTVKAASEARMSGYVLRLVVGLVVFLIALAILFSVGLPIVGTLLGAGSPRPVTGG